MWKAKMTCTKKSTNAKTPKKKGDTVSLCLLFRVPLVLPELLASPDQEEDPDPRDPREPLDREVSL